MKPKELNIVRGMDQRNALRAEGDLQQRGRNAGGTPRKASIDPESAVEWARFEM
jgi:hypothetical protein